jgi:hypothetical protein
MHHNITIETWVRFNSVATQVLFSKNKNDNAGGNAENLLMFYIDTD